MISDAEYERAQLAIRQTLVHMEQSLFEPGARITFVVRFPGNTEAELVCSNDESFEEVKGVLDRSRLREMNEKNEVPV